MQSQVEEEQAALPLSFEEAMAELEENVKKLEQGSVSLEESIRLYERGELLKRHCDVLLQRAEMRISKLVISSDGHILEAETMEESI